MASDSLRFEFCKTLTNKPPRTASFAFVLMILHDVLQNPDLHPILKSNPRTLDNHYPNLEERQKLSNHRDL
jgi:hypothetical protein